MLRLRAGFGKPQATEPCHPFSLPYMHTSLSPGGLTPSAGGSPFLFADQFSRMRSAPTPHSGSCVSSNSGNKVVQVTVPDTITEWKAMTFCTSQSRGFGLSPTVGLTAFQPFFVDLMLPYSVVRGESFRLTATVFNYLKDCIRVRAGLPEAVQPCKPTRLEACQTSLGDALSVSQALSP